MGEQIIRLRFDWRYVYWRLLF